jgi:hypothetical protein
MIPELLVEITVPSGRNTTSPVAGGCCVVEMSLSPASVVVCDSCRCDPVVLEIPVAIQKNTKKIAKNMSVY